MFSPKIKKAENKSKYIKIVNSADYSARVQRVMFLAEKKDRLSEYP
jgi:hypothetical protein